MEGYQSLEVFVYVPTMALDVNCVCVCWRVMCASVSVLVSHVWSVEV